MLKATYMSARECDSTWVAMPQMGLGKTIQVIALIAYLVQAREETAPFLIVTPASLTSNW